jgi:hypothetical protein
VDRSIDDCTGRSCRRLIRIESIDLLIRKIGGLINRSIG